MAKQSTKTVLSVRQPWAWLLVHGHKDIENRRWSTTFRGRCLIHAGKTFDQAGYDRVKREFKHIKMPQPDEFELGGIVGWVDIADCVTGSKSKWFSGPYGFVIGRAGRLPFFPARGKLKFFELDDSVDLRVDVTPPALIEGSSQKAKVQVSINGAVHYPLAGLRLTGKTSPAQLGSVTGLPVTDESGKSTGEWRPGRTAIEGWLVVECQFGAGQAAIELFTPVLQVTVKPPVLPAGSKETASVVVRLKDPDGNPLRGISLHGKTVPSSLGQVSGLPGTNGKTSASSTEKESNLPDTDSNGMSMGLWWAGSQPGRGWLVVEAKDSGHKGQAAIELIPEPVSIEPDGPGLPDPPEQPGPVVTTEDPEPAGTPGTKSGGSKPSTSNRKGKGEDKKRPRRPKPKDEEDDDDDRQKPDGDKGEREGGHDGERGDVSQGSTGSRSPHLGTQSREPTGSKGGRPGRRGPGHKDSGTGG